MKVYISYSMVDNDEFFITLFSIFLKEDKITTTLNQNTFDEAGFPDNRNYFIDDSSLFVGIIFKGGNKINSVVNEWNYAIEKGVYNLLLLEDGVEIDDIDEKNFLKFDRLKCYDSIREIERKMQPKSQNYSIIWLLVGNSLKLTLDRAFLSQNIKASYVISGRLRLIEDRLIGIDSAAFQNLCDIYLVLREQDIVSINRTGSQLGKQKTVKGTPDTFFRLADGSLRYVEYTTKDSGIVEKIKEDIDKCLDSDKTGLPMDQVHRIIICYNSRLNVAQETAITQHATLKNVQIELIGLDWLSLEIYSKYLIIAKDILGIPLDTGQLLPLQFFVEEYNNKAGKLSTPLDNIFLHRKAELNDIKNILAGNDILIISGFPGVGKTKIALEAVNRFLLSHTDYLAFAVSKKDQDISEDLKIHLQQERNYIILVDDANRQLLNFKQLVGIFKENRRREIKILVTVRDYALNDIVNECLDFKHENITINKFSDEEITELIQTEPFEIKNPKYQRMIVGIADGNARLAVMASKLAKQEEVDFLYGGGERIFELYDYYFKTFIRDFDIFSNKILIKTLGIISFFFTIDRSNKVFIDSLLDVFKIDYYEFNESIDELEKRELVEVKYNNARVSEQVMATYFFYKTFIRDEVLSFKSLIFNFFPNWKRRFSDTIIPSNNSFGYESVLNRINGTLDEYLNSVYSNEEKVLDFFSIFWFYKRDEVLNYFNKKIKELPEPVMKEYDTHYDKNDFVYAKDHYIDYISKIFSHYDDNFIQALQLGFEYCRKRSKSLPEFVKRIRERLLFEEDDYIIGFQRQIELFNLLIAKFRKGEAHYVKAFFALSETFLSHFYQITRGGRNNSITLYQYPLPLDEVIIKFRKSLWITLFDHYEIYPKDIILIIKHVKNVFAKPIPEILEFDLELLITFLGRKLNPMSFENIHFVNEFVILLDRQKLSNRSYQNLTLKFNSREYEYFKMLDWNIRRGKQQYEFDKIEDFQRLKEQDVRNFFVFANEGEFDELHKAINNTLLLKESNAWGLDQSLNVILEENFNRDHEIGFKLLDSILNNYPVGIGPLNRAVKAIVSESKDWALRLWKLLQDWKHQSKIYWQLSFFDYLPDEYVNDFYKNELLFTINSINVKCYIRFESFEKFLLIDNNIILIILQIVVEKMENDKVEIMLSYHFFEKYSRKLEDNFDLLKKAYILQEKKVGNSFDLNHAGFETLVRINPEFFNDYISLVYAANQDSFSDNFYNGLPFVWDLDNHNLLLKNAINAIIDNRFYMGISVHPISVFFLGLNDERKVKAKVFLLNYITEYSSDTDKMNSVFDVLRHSMSDFFEEAFLHFLNVNSNLGDFQKIWWCGNGGTYSGEVIIGEVKARDWQNILEMVMKSKNQLDIIPIKAYVKKQISCSLENAEDERKRKFVNPDGW